MNPAVRLLRPETTALILIDFQEKLVPSIDGIERVLANSKKLIRLAQTLSMPIFLTTQYAKGLGATLTEIAELVAAEPLDKVCFGCFGDDPFRAALAEAAPQNGTLLLAGIESHICVAQTALGALGDGYNVHVASDAVSSRTVENRAAGLERMRSAGAVMSTTEMAIYELLGNSSRAEFKQMLPYLK